MLAMSPSDADPLSDGANPFDELRPVLRSEEDDIRKGIFSTALKRLRTITPEEKIDWCLAIQEATAPKVAGSVVGAKRAREAVAHDAAPPSTPAADPVATLVATENQEHVPSAESLQAERVATVQSFTQEAASAYVAAFMRAQLDKVVGGSLNNLGVAALRVLCLMLGIVTRARGKDALYNTLASYYYTHCEKLGKRVSRDTVSKNLAQQEAEMLNRLLPSAAAKPHPSQHKNANASSAASLRTEKAGKENTPRAPARAAVSTKGHLAPLPAQSHHAKTARDSAKPKAGSTAAKAVIPTHSTVVASDDVDYGGRVFSRPARAVVSSSSCPVEAEEEPALCGVALERKVASIIQLYDPVTVDIIVKKLAQFGFRHERAPHIVEDILRTFHQKQLIFFDSGIAYMM